MKDNWFNHNTDKLLLYSLVILGGVFMMHVIHHGGSDAQLLTWLENAFSTVLGALILILTGRIARAGNGSTNGTPPPPPGPDTLNVTLTPEDKK